MAGTTVRPENATTQPLANFTRPTEMKYLTCQQFLFLNETVMQNFYEKALYGFLAPAILIMIVLSFLVFRKHLCRHILDGRPGIPEPVRLLDEQTNRGTFVAAFVLSAWILADVVIGESPFDWNYPSYLTSLMMFCICILLALMFYPIFAGLTSRSVPGLILASLFTWAWTVVLIIKHGPCINSRAWHDWLLYFFNILPAVGVSLYLCIVLPYRAGVLLFCHEKATGKFLIDNRHAYQVIHVRNLVNKKSNANIEISPLRKVESAIYRPIPGFRYGLTILAAVWVSIFIAYSFALTLMNQYYLLLTMLRPLVARAKVWEDALARSFPSATPEQRKKLDDTVHMITRETAFWTDSIEAILLVSVFLAFVITTISLFCTLRNYRKHLLYLYRGVHKGIPRITKSWSPRNIVVTSAKYIGYQMGFATWGFIVQSLIIVFIILIPYIIIVLMVRYHVSGLLEKLLLKFGPPLLFILIVLVLQHIFVQLFFLRKDAHGNTVLAINNRRAFSNFQYFMVFVNAPLGLLSCLLRIIKAIVFGIWTLPRLDVSTLSRNFEEFDNGFTAYVALLSLENAQTNPLLVVFINLLWETLERDKNSHKPFQNRAVVLTRKSKIHRNRWYLFVTLHNNPALRLYRKEGQDVNVAHEIVRAGLLVSDISFANGIGQKQDKKEEDISNLVAKGEELIVKIESSHV